MSNHPPGTPGFEWVESELAAYIREQSKQYVAQARALGMAQKRSLTGYFSQADLERARVLDIAGQTVAEPAFYTRVRTQGLHGLPGFSLMEAITFYDVILTRPSLDEALLFQEMVHVTQYRLLGVDRFARLYVRGFLASGCYEGIPLEACARLLTERYMRDQHHFDVETAVRAWLDSGDG